MNIQSLALRIDANNDGVYNMWELWDVAKAIYRLPGNLVVEGLGNLPLVANFLNINASVNSGYSSLNGTLAVAISLVFWVAILFTVLTVTSPSAPLEEDGNTLTNAGQAPSSQHALHNHHVHAASLHQHAAAPRRGLAAKAATVPRDRAHLPVSRTYYAAPGKKPIRKRNRLRLAH